MKNCILFRFCFFLFFLSIGRSGFGQMTPADSIDATIVKPYNDHFSIKREVLHIHANKQTFLPGELLAFKVYILSAHNQLPFLETRNIYIDFFSSEGTMIHRQIIYAEGGSGIGNFLLLARLLPGDYTLRAYTSWSRNFGTASYAQQVITVLGAAPVDSQLVKDDDFVVEVFPEGGSAVADAETTYGLKLTDKNGRGKKAELTLKKNGKVQQVITTNVYGFAAVNVKQTLMDRFELEWTQPNGQVKQQSIASPFTKGIQLNVPYSLNDSLLTVEVRTNAVTAKEIWRQKFYLLFHRQGTVHKLHWVGFANQRPTVRQQFLKKDFPEGLLHITLFDSSFRPIADRAIYIPNKTKPVVTLDGKLYKDTGIIDLLAVNHKGVPVEADLSVSILPTGTKADKFSSSLLSRYLLEHDINGFIEDPHYYFEEDDSIRLRHLDELLLVQGWRSYDWTAILNQQHPKTIFPFEQGFDVRGHVPGFASLKNQGSGHVILSSPSQELFLKSTMDSVGNFEFRQLFLQKGVGVSLFGSSASEARRYKNLTVPPQTFFFDTIASPRGPLSQPSKLSQAEIEILRIKDNILEEVKIKNRVDERPPMPMIELFMPGDKIYTFNDRDRTRYQNLREYLVTNHGVRVYERVELDKNDPNFKRIVYHVSFNFRTSFDLPSDPVLIIDGAQVSDLRIIESFPTRDVEAVAVNKYGTLTAAFGAGGAIVVKTRTTQPEPKDKETNQIKRLMLEGYAIPTAYYTQNYTMPIGSEMYNRYACLHWKPDIDTDSTGKGTFAFPNTSAVKDMLFVVEGVGKNGELFYLRKKLSLKDQAH